jgi:uncharacterized OB-fold protein
MPSADKQIPRPTELDLEFFRASAHGRLHVQQCDACSDHHHPPRLYCPRCFSRDQHFQEASGEGVVYGYTVSHYSAEPAWKDQIPWVTVVVELAEGPRVVGTARGMAADEVSLGRPVRVEVERITDDFTYLWVEPTENGRG